MKARFKKKKYVVVRNILSPEMSDFLYKYFLLKRQVAQTMFKERFSPCPGNALSRKASLSSSLVVPP